MATINAMVGGKTVEVEVSNDGQFMVTDPENAEARITGNTLEEVTKRLMRANKRKAVRVEVEVVLKEAATKVPFSRVTLRGKAAIGYSKFLITRADGTKETVDHPVLLGYGADYTDEEIARLNALYLEAARASSAASHTEYKMRLDKGYTYETPALTRKPESAWAIVEAAMKAAGVE